MRKVLIIDDDQGLREKYRKVLESDGYNVVETPDALSVAETLMRERSEIGLILLDIQMPEVDGRDIYDIVREYAPEIPVVVSSVLPIQDQKLRIPKARGYFSKSDDDKALLDKVKLILN